MNKLLNHISIVFIFFVYDIYGDYENEKHSNLMYIFLFAIFIIRTYQDINEVYHKIIKWSISCVLIYFLYFFIMEIIALITGKFEYFISKCNVFISGSILGLVIMLIITYQILNYDKRKIH